MEKASREYCDMSLLVSLDSLSFYNLCHLRGLVIPKNALTTRIKTVQIAMASAWTV